MSISDSRWSESYCSSIPLSDYISSSYTQKNNHLQEQPHIQEFKPPQFYLHPIQKKSLFPTLLRDWRGVPQDRSVQIYLLQGGRKVTVALSKVSLMRVQKFISFLLTQFKKDIQQNLKNPELLYHKQFFELRPADPFGSPDYDEPLLEETTRLLDLDIYSFCLIEISEKQILSQQQQALCKFGQLYPNMVFVRVRFQGNEMLLKLEGNKTLLEIYIELQKKFNKVNQRDYQIFANERLLQNRSFICNLSSYVLTVQPKRFLDQPRQVTSCNSKCQQLFFNSENFDVQVRFNKSCFGSSQARMTIDIQTIRFKQDQRNALFQFLGIDFGINSTILMQRVLRINQIEEGMAIEWVGEDRIDQVAIYSRESHKIFKRLESIRTRFYQFV